MTRMTKIVLTFAVTVLMAIATAALVVKAYQFRGYFSVGGEWLLPILAAAVAQAVREIKNLYKNTMRKDK